MVLLAHLRSWNVTSFRSPCSSEEVQGIGIITSRIGFEAAAQVGSCTLNSEIGPTDILTHAEPAHFRSDGSTSSIAIVFSRQWVTMPTAMLRRHETT